MATTRTSRVSVGIGAEVTGTKDIDRFADTLKDLPDQQDVQVAAKVIGDKDVSGLADDLGKMPKNVTTKIDARVSGDEQVDGLTTDLQQLPKNTTTKITATVAGGKPLEDVATDLSRMPKVVTARVDASVNGNQAVDSLSTDLDGIKSKDVTVTATVKTGSGGSPKDLRDDLDDVGKSSHGAQGELSGFASEVTGTLGGQFSDGAGMVADFAEQFRNLKEKSHEAGGMSGLAGLAAIAGGIGGTILGGLLVDQVVGALGQIAAEQQLVKDAVTETSQALVDNGGAWTASIQQAMDAKIAGSDVFQELLSEGTDWGTAMEALTGKLGDPVDAVNQIMTQHGKSLGIMEQNTVRGLANIAGASEDAADSQLDYYKKWGLLTQAQKDAIASSKSAADGVDLVGNAMRDAGKDTDYATGRVKSFNSTDLKDKDATLTAKDQASPKVDAANKKKLGDKSNTLKSTDQASPRVDAVNRKDLKDKKSYLSVTDLATGPVDSFNRKDVPDKTANVYANTDPAQRQIDTLAAGKIYLDTILQIDPAQLRRLGIINSPDGLDRSAGVAAVAPDDAARGLTATPAVSASTAPTFHGTLTVPVAVAPVTIIIQGAIDPASTARQVNQLLTRAGRRTSAARMGGRYGPSRAPV